jgi:uncharacterized membrane protein
MLKLKEQRWLYISMAFSCSLLLIRMLFTHSYTYIFFGWNLFLAWIPFVVSNTLPIRKRRFEQITLLFLWLIFFPNAPYIITDFFHFEERVPVPLYYDLVLSFSFAWNGLLLGFISLLNVERWLSNRLGKHKSLLIVLFCLFLCGFGIYIGRYLRWNSWDVFMNPLELSTEIAERILNPFQYLRTWIVTGLFTLMLTIIYFNIKNISRLLV